MKLIKPSFEIWEQGAGLEGVYKQIERAGRVCYKSEDKITETSAKEFVKRMIKSGHGAMLEHGTVYLNYSSYEYFDKENGFPLNKYEENPYSKCMIVKYPLLSKIEGWVTTNLRVLVENGWLDDLQYICEPTEYHAKRHTIKFICDRGVSHEFVRHRVFSFAQESTRYCNYSKDKFGNELTFIIPNWLSIPEGGYELFEEDDTVEGLSCYSLSNEEWATKDLGVKAFLRGCDDAELTYFELLKQGWKPQEARAVLPNSLKTELVVTGFASDWEHFFKLRDTGSAHPQARELAHPLHMEFLRRKYLVSLYDEANPD
nr:MAG TPA: Thymidylate synthase complementing protein [Crassvirales sp.]